MNSPTENNEGEGHQGTQSNHDLIKQNTYNIMDTPYNANIFSKLTFWYMGDALALARKRFEENTSLKEADIYPLGKEYNGNAIVEAFLAIYYKNRSLMKSLVLLFGYRGILTSTLLLIYSLCSIANPLIIERLLKSIVIDTEPDVNYETSKSYGYLLSGILMIIMILKVFCGNHGMDYQSVLLTRTYTAVYGSLYTKLLRICGSAKNHIESGRILTMFSTDASVMCEFINNLNQMISSPVLIIAGFVLMYLQVSWCTFLAYAIILIIIFLQQFGMSLLLAYWFKLMSVTDKRIQFLNEVFEGIRIIKLYAWERFAYDRTASVREMEISYLFKALLTRTTFMLGIIATPILLFLTVFGVYSRCIGNLTVARIFTTISIFAMVQQPFNMLFFVLTMAMNLKVSVTRVEGFLNSEDTIPMEVSRCEKGEIIIEQASFAWDTEATFKKSNELNKVLEDQRMKKIIMKMMAKKMKEEAKKNPKEEKKGKEVKEVKEAKVPQIPEGKPLGAPLSEEERINTNLSLDKKDYTILKDIDLKIRNGEFYAVVGSVGCGKSSLLNSIIGEMIKTSGKVSINGKVSYVSQTPWIINGSVKANIILGEEYNEQRYKQVIKICELEEDLEIFTNGDSTEIGSKGINLSGGQKQRVCIARSIYKNSDIYLIDDCLSALDAHVGQKIFDNVLMRWLQGKTVVFVTHGVHYLRGCKNIIYMNKGKIMNVDSFDWLFDNCEDFRKIALSKNTQIKEEKKDSLLDPAHEEKKLPEAKSGLPTENKFQGSLTVPGEKPKPKSKDLVKLITEEKQEIGGVKLINYYYFFQYGGMVLGLLVILFYMGSSALQILQQHWLGRWGEYGGDGSENGYYIGVYCAFGASCIVIDYSLQFIFVVFIKNLARNSHMSLIKRILGAPLLWFDQTPVGRIVSRVSNDQNTIDKELIWQFQFTVQMILTTLAAIILIAILLPWFTFIIGFTLILFFFFYNYYVQGARDTKRIESKCKSPIFTLFGEALEGLTTIRATDLKALIDSKMYSLIAKLVESNLMMNRCTRWVSLRVDLITAVMVGLVSFFVIIFKTSVSSSSLGLALSQGVSICICVSYILIFMGMLEVKMSSLERVIEYANEIIQEKDFDNPKAPANWPTSGQVSITNLAIKYRKDLPYVLKDFSFDIKGGEKIGVSGRTGSGKSTLMLALMRIMEPFRENPQNISPVIRIDGVDCESIGLHELRKKIAIIPQDPFLFSGTIKTNVDPFNDFKEQDILDSIKKSKIAILIGLKIKNSKISDQERTRKKSEADIENEWDDSLAQEVLNYEVKEKGTNFSVGEKQLICIARALVKKPKILLMDEATASIDENTDNFIQLMIKKEFKNCTVITIAHRIKTIINYDRIIFLKNGLIIQHGKPNDLLRNTEGPFYHLVAENGEQFLNDMQKLANEPISDS